MCRLPLSSGCCNLRTYVRSEGVAMTVLEQPPPREVDVALISFDLDPSILLSPVPVPMQMLQVARDELGRIDPAELSEEQSLALGSMLVAAQDQIQGLALRSVADID